MNITLTFVEYDALNGLRGLGEVAFKLVSTATLGSVGNNRHWVIDGSVEAFGAMRHDIRNSMERFQRSSVAAALADVSRAIDAALEAAQQKEAKAVPVPTPPLGSMTLSSTSPG